MLTVGVVADDEFCQRDVGGAARLQRDRVGPEVFQHVVDVGKPEVLDSALARLAKRHSKVLRATLGMKINIVHCNNKF